MKTLIRPPMASVLLPAPGAASADELELVAAAPVALVPAPVTVAVLEGVVPVVTVTVPAEATLEGAPVSNTCVPLRARTPPT